jgi:hypothetical protein
VCVCVCVCVCVRVCVCVDANVCVDRCGRSNHDASPTEWQRRRDDTDNEYDGKSILIASFHVGAPRSTRVINVHDKCVKILLIHSFNRDRVHSAMMSMLMVKLKVLRT